MILALNHLLRLNGNKFIYFFCVVAFVLSSCGSSKKVLKDRNSNRKPTSSKPQTKSNNEKVKEVNWTVLSEKDYPPISYNKDVEEDVFITKNRYNINLLLPLGADNLIAEAKRETSIHDDRFLNFYAGALLAVRDLEKEGVGLEVNVFDTNKSDSKVKSILQSVNNRADIIIGPYTKKELKVAADYSKSNKVTVVSPWRSVSSSVAKNNEYFVQLRPNLRQYRTAILEHALQNFKREEILIVGQMNKASDKKLIDRFHDVEKDLSGFGGELIKEFMVDNEMIFNSDTIFYHMIHAEKDAPKAIIIPNYLTADEDFVYGLLRRLNVEQGENRVAIYGMPIMFDSDKIDFDLYRSLDVRIARSKFVDRMDNDIRNFERKYFNEYKELPSDAAMEGYDVVLYFGNALQKYGVNFQKHLSKENTRNLQASYNITPTYLDAKNSSRGDGLTNLKCYENTHIDMVEYVNNRFQIMRK